LPIRLSVVVVDVAVKANVSGSQTAGLGEPDADVKVPEDPPAETSTLTGPPNAVESPP
jgi:hypothetical protein